MLFRLAANSLGLVAEINRIATGSATKYLMRNIYHIKQLLRCQIIPPEQMAEYMPGAIQCCSLIRVEQKDEQIIQQ